MSSSSIASASSPSASPPPSSSSPPVSVGAAHNKKVEILNQGSIKRKHKRILVTGGAGFIGSHLIDRLVIHADRSFMIENLRCHSFSFVSPRFRWSPLNLCVHIVLLLVGVCILCCWLFVGVCLTD